jgi:hypothetical protein
LSVLFIVNVANIAMSRPRASSAEALDFVQMLGETRLEDMLQLRRVSIRSFEVSAERV